MNKKLITLCVSALLAGGMVAPSYAAVTSAVGPVAINDWSTFNEHFYYEIKVLGSSGATTVNYNGNYALKATYDEYGITETTTEISGYSLWRFEAVKNANGVLQGYKIVNAYGIPLAATKTNTGYVLDREGSCVIFEFENNQIKLSGVQVGGLDVFLAWDQTAYNNGESGLCLSYGTPANLSACVYEPESTYNTADQLENVFDGYFGLQIGRPDKDGNFDGYEDEGLQGNVFTGKLYTANNQDLKSSNSSVTIHTLDATNGETFLRNEAGEFIVLLKDKWNVVNTDLDPSAAALKGYRFATMTAKELGEDLAKPAKDQTVQSYVFRIAGVNGHIKDVDAPLEVAVKAVMNGSATDDETWAELLVAGVKNESGEISYYLTTAKASDDNAYISTSSDNLDLNVADYVESTWVKFGMNNFVNPTTFWGAAWNIERQDDKTPNPQSGKWVDKREVGYTVPEGQWILREISENGNSVATRVQAWVNRETGDDLNANGKLIFSTLRTTDEANVYTDGTYTYKITKAVDLADWDRFDYFGYDAKETSTGVEETYKVMFNSNLTGEPIYIMMDGVGELHLTNDATKAIEFHVDTIKTTDDAAVVNDLGLNANPDIFDIVNKYMGKDKDGNWVEKEDTVSFYRYTLSHNGKYLHYDATNNKYVLNTPVYNDGRTGAAGTVDMQGKSHLMYNEADHEVDAFVIKEKGGDFVNIISVNKEDFDNYDETRFDHLDGTYLDGTTYVNGAALLGHSTSTAAMMYFDFFFYEARQQQDIYDWVANAQLQLDYQDYNIYRNVAAAPDTMAIYRTEYQDEFLFEKNDFLGMTVDQRGYNAALFIDTAYVRNNTEKPLFMIGLRPEITPETVFCPIHGENAGCAHEHLDTIPGYVDADYLAVLADSAAFHAAELKNEFLANSAYTKLAFIQARHNVDTITVADDNHKTTIVEGVQHPMVFAFRIVNQETQDFIIEGVDLADNKAEFDAQKNPYVTSWVRWNNGVPVMTDRMEDAEVFNIAGDIESAPTANEAIEAEATVTVVATDGAVIVKGAEGKNVIVSTILGKVVANETVNSDNETIAAPAGIVVVSVDGESFKVAVK